MNKDMVFKCHKCSHMLYLTRGTEMTGNVIAEKLFSYDCPDCGEEGEENWIFVELGNFDTDT